MKGVGITLFCLLLTIANSRADEDHKHTLHIIEITGFKFVPSHVNLAKGDKVLWINRDTIPHNIVNQKNDMILSPTLAKDDEFSYIIKEDMNYACGFHPSMLGSLQVK